jgi:hypothetical protein
MATVVMVEGTRCAGTSRFVWVVLGILIGGAIYTV